VLGFFNVEKENIMSQIIHCCILFYIVFVIIQIRNVLLQSDPWQAAPITIWEEMHQPSGEDSYQTVYRL
jgi:hypothetical protein